MRLIVDAEETDETCYGVANFVDGPNVNIVQAPGGNPVGNDPYACANYDSDPRNDTRTRGAAARR